MNNQKDFQMNWEEANGIKDLISLYRTEGANIKAALNELEKTNREEDKLAIKAGKESLETALFLSHSLRSVLDEQVLEFVNKKLGGEGKVIVKAEPKAELKAEPKVEQQAKKPLLGIKDFCTYEGVTIPEKEAKNIARAYSVKLDTYPLSGKITPEDRANPAIMVEKVDKRDKDNNIQYITKEVQKKDKNGNLMYELNEDGSRKMTAKLDSKNKPVKKNGKVVMEEIPIFVKNKTAIKEEIKRTATNKENAINLFIEAYYANGGKSNSLSYYNAKIYTSKLANGINQIIARAKTIKLKGELDALNKKDNIYSRPSIAKVPDAKKLVDSMGKFILKGEFNVTKLVSSDDKLSPEDKTKLKLIQLTTCGRFKDAIEVCNKTLKNKWPIFEDKEACQIYIGKLMCKDFDTYIELDTAIYALLDLGLKDSNGKDHLMYLPAMLDMIGSYIKFNKVSKTEGGEVIEEKYAWGTDKVAAMINKEIAHLEDAMPKDSKPARLQQNLVVLGNPEVKGTGGNKKNEVKEEKTEVKTEAKVEGKTETKVETKKPEEDKKVEPKKDDKKPDNKKTVEQNKKEDKKVTPPTKEVKNPETKTEAKTEDKKPQEDKTKTENSKGLVEKAKEKISETADKVKGVVKTAKKIADKQRTEGKSNTPSSAKTEPKAESGAPKSDDKSNDKGPKERNVLIEYTTNKDKSVYSYSAKGSGFNQSNAKPTAKLPFEKLVTTTLNMFLSDYLKTAKKAEKNKTIKVPVLPKELEGYKSGDKVTVTLKQIEGAA